MKKITLPIATLNLTAEDWLCWVRNYNASVYNSRQLTKEESLALRDALINPEKGYERVAQEFFFETLKPMVSGFAYKILVTYKTVVNPLDLSTTIYREFWDGGKFTRLKRYQGNCSLFSWIALGAAQIIYDDLENLGIIKKNHELTSKNTSLRLKSITDKDELNAILDLVTEPLWHDILTEIYVTRISDEAIMQKFNMDKDTFKKTKKIAEANLKEQLIATEFVIWHRPATKQSKKGTTVNLVSLALGDVSGNLNTTSSEDALIVAQNKFSNLDAHDEIMEMLLLKYPDMDPQSMWETFVKDQTLVCGMTTVQLKVWHARYIDHESAESVAEWLGIRRANVDNIYSRANHLLVEHIRNLWKKNS